MADGGGGGALVPRPSRTCPQEWKSFFGCLVTLMRQTAAQRAALAVELDRVLGEMEHLKRVHNQRLALAEDSIQQIRRGAAVKEEAAKLLERKEPPPADDLGVDELEDNYLECLRSLSTLICENTKLKNKLKNIENQAEFAEDNVDQQGSAKDLRAELRKLKHAYKTLVSDKDKEICAIRAEKCFVWNQYKTLEQEFRDTCNSKNIEVMKAHTAAKVVEETVNELRLEVQNKDCEIGRLKEEAARAKEEILMMKIELEQMQKRKDAKTDQTDQLEGPISRGKSRIPHATPVRTEKKTSRKHVLSGKGTEERGKSETTPKRKRGSSTSSHGPRRSSSRLQVRPAAASPNPLLQRFNFPKLTSPTPTKL